MIDGRLVVTQVFNDSAAAAAGLARGTVITQIAGEDASARVDRYRGAYSSTSTREAENARSIYGALGGREGVNLPLRIIDAKGRAASAFMPHSNAFVRSTDADRIRWLSPGIGYVRLAQLPVGEVDSVLKMFANAKGIVFDLRIPTGWSGSDAASWKLLAKLGEPTDAVAMQVRVPTVALPLLFGSARYVAQPAQSTFDVFTGGSGKTPVHRPRTAILVNEFNLSAMESAALEWKAAYGTAIVGSPTAGANSDISSVVLPGGIEMSFTGSDRATPDGHPVTGFGIQPDINVRPTIAGLRAGRDEVIEAAQRFLNR
jgi:C-terminal processing protease CtpA/Prc